MYYSENDLDEIRKKVNIKDIISEYVSLQKIGSKWIGLCPFHNESTPSFIVDEENQTFCCFGCGKGGNVFNFLMDYYDISFLEALEKITGKKQKVKDVREKEKKKTVDINTETAKFYQEALTKNKDALKYIKERNLSKEMLEKFQIGYSLSKNDLYLHLRKLGFKEKEINNAGLIGFGQLGTKKTVYDKFRNRLMFPIENIDGLCIGFGGRILKKEKGKKEAKYINSQETDVFDKSGNLYGMNFAKDSSLDYFILCEGYMDVISLHQYGFTNAIASLGTAFTEKQSELIKRYKKKVILSYDTDGPGIKAARRAAPILQKNKIEIYCLDLNPYKDPDEFLKACGSEELEKRIKNALTLEEWLFAQAYKNDDINIITKKEPS